MQPPDEEWCPAIRSLSSWLLLEDVEEDESESLLSVTTPLVLCVPSVAKALEQYRKLFLSTASTHPPPPSCSSFSPSSSSSYMSASRPSLSTTWRPAPYSASQTSNSLSAHPILHLRRLFPLKAAPLACSIDLLANHAHRNVVAFMCFHPASRVPYHPR